MHLMALFVIAMFAILVLLPTVAAWALGRLGISEYSEAVELADFPVAGGSEGPKLRRPGEDRS